eukprot:2937359-Pleurochrysis_carterae.AAC.1
MDVSSAAVSFGSPWSRWPRTRRLTYVHPAGAARKGAGDEGKREVGAPSQVVHAGVESLLLRFDEHTALLARADGVWRPAAHS